MYESDRQISFNSLNKFMISLPAVIGASGSPLGPHPKSDIPTDLCTGFTLIAIVDKSDHRISFNRLNKFVISLPAVFESSGSPLEPHPERDLAMDLYFGSTPIAIKTSSIAKSVLDDFKKSITSLQKTIKA
jgi:hypothetical protein